MLKCHKGLELDTIPDSDLGTLFLPKLRPPQSAGSLFQSPSVFIGRAMHRELEAPSGSIRDLSIVELSPRLTQASLTMEVLVARVRRSMISRRYTRLRKRAPVGGSRPSRTIRFRDCWNA